jgi:hypothetical protein
MGESALLLVRRAVMVLLVWFALGSVSWAKPVVKCDQATKATAYVSGTPSDIVVVPFNGVPVSKILVNPLYVMFVAAENDGVPLNLESGFRTNGQQKALYDCYQKKLNTGNCPCGSCNEAAPPGYSNHQSGHAVDITTTCSEGQSDASCKKQSPMFTWLMANAGFYGFEKTVKSEPWHWEWWSGGPGGGICDVSCEKACLFTSPADLKEIKKINKGWIGGSCKTDEQCDFAGGFCAPGPDGFTGMCSQACTKFCPDKADQVVTFCVDGKNIQVDDPPGTCAAKCSMQKSPTGCRPGYVCVNLPRYNEPGTTAETCVPNTDPNFLNVFDWSFGLMKADCTTKTCAADLGQACTDDGGAHCAFAVCLDPDTNQVKPGLSCSNLFSEHGHSVECNAKGKLLNSEACTADKPCNACGTCGDAPQEVCDGEDNNCDGQVDEGVLNACGSCGDVPTEVCDGKDNNCDGQVDEGVLNACGTCGDAPLEVCDGEDNNCDGQVDEGVLNACGSCGDVPQEVCDGEDNNCDGQVDEGVLNACGACGDVPLEVCDGEDNDCDGEIDELPDCDSESDITEPLDVAGPDVVEDGASQGPQELESTEIPAAADGCQGGAPVKPFWPMGLLLCVLVVFWTRKVR